MAMMKVRLFLDKLNGWQRSWCLVSLTWLISCIVVTTYSIPFLIENEISFRSILSAIEIFKAESENIESAKAECHAKEVAAGITVDLECLKHVLQMKQRYSQNIGDATSRIRAEAEENLLPSQISVVEKGAAVDFPILGLYLFGMGLAWVRRGFTKTEGTGESYQSPLSATGMRAGLAWRLRAKSIRYQPALRIRRIVAGLNAAVVPVNAAV